MKNIYFEDNLKINKSIITIGNFDGVHLGHKHIINSMKKISINSNIPLVLITFNPHTNDIIFNKKTSLLTIHSEKIKHLDGMGIDYLSVVNFDAKTSKIKIDDFMGSIIRKYNPSYLFIGYDNSFGYKKMGTYDYLSSSELYKNIKIVSCKPLKINKIKVKSSLIKDYILNGDMKKANKILGYYYTISGTVIKGEGIGSKIGFPTANIQLTDKKQLIPSNGVYSVNLINSNTIYSGICNIGFRPTVSNKSFLTIEVHLHNINTIDIYNELIKIEFKYKIRDEICFSSISKLKEQIKKDIKFLVKENND